MVLLSLHQSLLATQTLVSDETLDVSAFEEGLPAAALDLSRNDVLPDVVFLFQFEEPSQLRCSLGSQTTGHFFVSETLDLVISDLLNGHRNGSEVRADNASTDGLALLLTLAAGLVSGVSFAHEESDSSVDKDALLHGEALLVVSSGDLELVALELISKEIAVDLVAHPLVHESSELILVVDFYRLLLAGSRVCYIELHSLAISLPFFFI